MSLSLILDFRERRSSSKDYLTIRPIDSLFKSTFSQRDWIRKRHDARTFVNLAHQLDDIFIESVWNSRETNQSSRFDIFDYVCEFLVLFSLIVRTTEVNLMFW